MPLRVLLEETTNYMTDESTAFDEAPASDDAAAPEEAAPATETVASDTASDAPVTDDAPTAEAAGVDTAETDAPAEAPAQEASPADAPTEETPVAPASAAVAPAPAADASAEAETADTDAGEAPAADTITEAPAAEEAPAADAAEPATAAAPARPAPGRPAIVPKRISELPDEIADDFEAALQHTMIEFSEGDIVQGTVVSITSDEVLVDVGFKSEGFVPVNELSIRKNVDPSDVVAVGDVIEAVVLDKEDDEGRLLLSKKRAQYERAWGRIEQISADGTTVTGPVIEVVKGGLIVDIGLRGFLPASLVELRRVRDLDPYVGQEIEAKVIELDRNRNNVVLSRRAHLEEAQAEQRQGFLDNLQVGEARDGVVSSVVNFGAFVDLGGMDGLVHVSELSYQHVNHPSEVVKVGDKVSVKVLEVDRDRERISLSIKQTREDPWVQFANSHDVGDEAQGKVTKTVPFGAFVTVGDGVEGLVHVSEIAMHRVDSPELELSIGQAVTVKVTEVDEERRRVSLSIKQALPEWKDRQNMRETTTTRRRSPEKREFEKETVDERADEPSFAVDSSLEAILQELKERGIGRR